jgi:predicted phage-related endonuclease
MSTLDARQYEQPGARDPGLIEAKTTKFEWDGTIPPDVYCQVQHQFAVTDWGWGSVVCWNRMTCELLIVEVKPDLDYIGELIEGENRFWQNLVAGVAPDADESEETTRALKLIYPKAIEGKIVNLDAALLDVTDDFELVKEEIKDAEDRKRALDNTIRAAIGDAEAGLLPNGVLYTHKLQHRKETVQRAADFRVLRRKEARNGI